MYEGEASDIDWWNTFPIPLIHILNISLNFCKIFMNIFEKNSFHTLLFPFLTVKQPYCNNSVTYWTTEFHLENKHFLTAFIIYTQNIKYGWI